ncbi:hypothetical protein ACTU45_34820 [Streptomyces sp. 24-1644]|uniref:hypothetical protein n=1 Tax=Streptomyces sp. 24-1644 TaxID=3457315 RepID=UPI003FA71C8A
MGIDCWEHDPALSSRANDDRSLAEENKRLRAEIEALREGSELPPAEDEESHAPAPPTHLTFYPHQAGRAQHPWQEDRAQPPRQEGGCVVTEVVIYAYAVARDADGMLEEEMSGLPGVADALVHLVRTAQAADVSGRGQPGTRAGLRGSGAAHTSRIWTGWKRSPVPTTG